MGEEFEVTLPTAYELDGQTRFRAYLNYVRGLNLIIRELYKSPNDLVETIRASQKCKAIQRRELDATLKGELARMLRNAWFTEIQLWAGASDSDLCAYTNHWAPVQAYYSCFLAARAVLTLSGTSLDRTHNSTLRALSNMIEQRSGLLPPPWGLLSIGDPSSGGARSLSQAPAEVDLTPISALSTPTQQTMWSVVEMFLRTSRGRDLKRRLEEEKGRLRIKRMSATQRAAVLQRLHSTSIFDGLYRLRIRSNYVDADAFLLSVGNTAEAVEYSEALRNICWHTLLVLETLLRAYAGKTEFTVWVADMTKYDRQGLSKILIQERARLLS